MAHLQSLFKKVQGVSFKYQASDPFSFRRYKRLKCSGRSFFIIESFAISSSDRPASNNLQQLPHVVQSTSSVIFWACLKTGRQHPLKPCFSADYVVISAYLSPLMPTLYLNGGGNQVIHRGNFTLSFTKNDIGNNGLTCIRNSVA